MDAGAGLRATVGALGLTSLAEGAVTLAKVVLAAFTVLIELTRLAPVTAALVELAVGGVTVAVAATVVTKATVAARLLVALELTVIPEAKAVPLAFVRPSVSP